VHVKLVIDGLNRTVGEKQVGLRSVGDRISLKAAEPETSSRESHPPLTRRSSSTPIAIKVPSGASHFVLSVALLDNQKSLESAS
jgi:hypothetical protein